MVLDFLLDPIFSPLLLLEPIFAIILVSIILSLIITLIYRKLTDQDLMKDLKGQIKELQAEMKLLKDKPDKMMEVQKKAMETNSKYMMHSLKPTLFTFLPIILIFGWLNSHMGYFPIVEDTEFTLTVMFEESVEGQIEVVLPDGIELVKGNSVEEIASGKSEWILQGDAGEYSIGYKFDDIEFSNDIVITKSKSERVYAKPVLREKDLGLSDSGISEVIVGNEKVKPFERVGLGFIPWIGGFGWLGTYIIFSIASSIIIRKLLKVY